MKDKSFKDTEFGDVSSKIWQNSIDLNWMKLTSLEGAPKEIKGTFHVFGNLLTNLKGTPKIIKGSFDCGNNSIDTLDYLPEVVDGIFDLSNNPLTQQEIYKLVQVKVKSKTIIPEGLTAPTREDYKLYKKLGLKKFLKIKKLKDKLK